MAEDKDLTQNEDTDKEETESTGMLHTDPYSNASLEELTSPDGAIGSSAHAEGEDAKSEDVEPKAETKESDTLGGLTEDSADKTADKGSEAPAAAPLSTGEGEGSDKGNNAAPAAAEEAPKDEQPKLAEAHPEAQPAVDAAPEVFEELKEAANIAGPALKKLSNFSEAIEKLEDEAKARFNFARQKMTEAVAALESIFKRS